MYDMLVQVLVLGYVLVLGMPTLHKSARMNSLFWTLGVDFSYHVQTNASVRRDIIRCTSVHSLHKGEVFTFSNVYI